MAKSGDRWHELCESVAADDGLVARPAGAWTRDKLIFWQKYLDITTTAMVGNPKWQGGLIYVDLFAGPGVCVLTGSGTRIPGSSLVAATTKRAFTRILACELTNLNADALEARLQRFAAGREFKVFRGDWNNRIDEIVGLIPPRALTLAFVDPTGLHVDFDTLAKLTHERRVDLLVLFADAMDAHRNFQLYAQTEGSKLDRFLGPEANWREELSLPTTWSRSSVCDRLADLYKAQLRSRLGYRYFREKSMLSGTTPIYRLIYASKNNIGLDFWDKAIRKDPGGQKTIDFGD